MTDDPFGPRRPRSARLEAVPSPMALGVPAPAVEAGSPRREQHREQGEGGDDGDERDEQAAVAEAAHEREGHHDEGEEADCHRHAAEEDRPPGGGHGDDDGLIVGPTTVAFLAPAGDDEQRVVDGHTEADQGDEILDQLADPGDRGEGAEEQERAEDGHGSHDERGHRQEGPEDEDQDEKGADGADEYLAQHADPTTARCVLQVVDTGGRHRDPRRGTGSQPGGQLDRGRRVVAGEHEPEGSVPVRRDQAGVVHCRVGHDDEAIAASASPPNVAPSAARPDGLSTRSVPRQGDDGDDRGVVAAVAVGVHDGEARLIARQSWERLARSEPSGDGADQCDADHRHHQPEEPDHLAVPEQRASQTAETGLRAIHRGEGCGALCR